MTREIFPIPEAVASRAPLLGQPGIDWLGRLPAIIATCLDLWDIELEGPFEELWYNYAASGRRHNESVVLKVCHPGHETLQEAEALHFFGGARCVRLLEYDLDLNALLMERALPGFMVETLKDPEAENAAAATVMRALWRPVPEQHPFPRAIDWLNEALEPSQLVETKRAYHWVVPVLSRAVEMAADATPVLLHGDLHHGNLLSAQREPWLAIDPQGIVGEAAWDVAPFLHNSLKKDEPADRPRLVRRRADQFAEELSMDRDWLYAWCAASALHNAYWSLRDEASDGENWRAAMACAEALARGPNARP